MNGPRARVVAIVFLAVLLVLLVLAPQDETAAEPAFQLSFGWAIKLIGGVLAVLGAVEVLFVAIERRTQDLPLVTSVLLAGLALTTPVWPVVLGLAALAVCQLVLPTLRAQPAAKAPARRKTASRK